jgi:hypothetical protein
MWIPIPKQSDMTGYVSLIHIFCILLFCP